MQSVTSNRDVVGRRVLEAQEHTDVLQEKTPKWRSIHQEHAVIPVLNQTTVAPNAYWRTIRNYTTSENTRVSRETTGTKKNRSSGVILPEINGYCKAEPTNRFRNLVCETIKRLQELECETNALQFCLLISKDVWRMKKYRKRLCDNDFSFMRANIGWFYTKHISCALTILQNHAKAGRSWEYVKEIDYIVQHFDFLFLDEGPSKNKSRSIVTKTYTQFFNNELDYLEHIKDSPLPYSVKNVSHIIERLLSTRAPAYFFKFLDKKYSDEIMMRYHCLLRVVSDNMSNSADKEVEGDDRKENDANKKRKGLDELWKIMLSEVTNIWAERKYHDALRGRLDEVIVKIKADDVTDQQRLCILEMLVTFYSQYRDPISKFRTLRKELEDLFIDVTTLMLMVVINDANNTNYFKTEILVLIGNLHERKWLDKRCGDLYLLCVQPQNVVKTTSQPYSVAYTQCTRQVESIFAKLRDKHENNFLTAAEMLKQMFHEYGWLIMALDGMNQLMKDVNVLYCNLYESLFSEVFNLYRRYKKRTIMTDPKEIDDLMSSFRCHIMRIEPYLFLLIDQYRDEWKEIACSAWNTHLVELSKKELFNKGDVDSLLSLKRIAPDIPGGYTVWCVQYALLQFLQFMLDHVEDVGSAFIEETVELSEWIDDLGKTYDLMEAMKNRNAQWKEKYKSLMSAKAKTSSDTPAGMMPASTHSGIMGISLAAAGCPSYTGEQTAPRMTQLLTAPLGIPAPAPVIQGVFQQPLSVSDSVPVSQSEAAVWSYPESYPELFPKPLSALQEAPVGDPLHLTEHSRVQTYFRQLPTGASVQPPWQMAPPQPSLFRQSTMSPEDKPEYPFVSGIQHMSEPSTESTGAMNLSPPINHEPSSVPIQDKRGQAASRTSIIQEQLDTSELCEQSPFDLPSKFETDPALEAMSCRYRPIDYDTPEMDNSSMARGQQCLIHVTARYLQQKKNGLDGLASDTLLPTDIGSDCYPIFMHGIGFLQNWLFQINGELIDRDEIYVPLMGLYNDDGDVMIRDLFNRSLEYQLDRGNFQIASNLLCLRNHLLFIRSLLELKNDNQPSHCPNPTGETRTV